MDTMTLTEQTATWRTAARLRSRARVCLSVLDGRIDGNHGTKPSTSTVNFLAIAPTRRGAPPL
jgi:hypothetical protein